MNTANNLPTRDSVRPAPAILASTLLDVELDRQRTAQRYQPWQTGIASLDSMLPKELWTGGKVIGIASVDWDESLSIHLMATHILSLTSSQAPIADQSNISPSPLETTAFIISPPNTTTISDLHTLLLSRINTSTSTPTKHSQPDPLDLLTTVSLLQYLDFAGLAESLSEVSQTLYSSSTSTVPATSSQPDPPSPLKVLYLPSLPQTLHHLTRRSTAPHTHAAALLAALVRQLTLLSRTHPHLLILLDLEVEEIKASTHSTSSSTSTSPGSLGSNDPCLLPSAFSNSTGTMLRLSPAGVVGQVLERGTDTIVAVHTREDPGTPQSNTSGKTRKVRIVEVVKDRTGTFLGAWGVWERGKR